MQVRETSTHKASGFSSDFFHTLIKQRPNNEGYKEALVTFGVAAADTSTVSGIGICVMIEKPH